MDLLGDILRDAGLQRRILALHGVAEGRGLRFPCDRSLGFHVVLDGTAWLHREDGAPPVELGAGDIVLMGRGRPHVVASRGALAGLPIEPMPIDAAAAPPAAPIAATLVSGAYQFWHEPVHPFVVELPGWHVVRAAAAPAGDAIARTVALLADELRSAALGRDSIVQALVDALFVQLLRAATTPCAHGGGGFAHAVRDTAMRAVVERMHADPARAWTLETLADLASLSRSAFAERFRATMGDTPLAYLRTVRLQRAMRLLAETDRTLERIAADVGYGDAFGFSKAFKRATGISPGEFRRRDAADRASPYRFPAASTG